MTRLSSLFWIIARKWGNDAIIGGQGVKLSGGQRQRLGLARALLANPVVLVLEEAMSSFDAASELTRATAQSVMALGS